jgi:hypothetical protein
MTDRRPCPSSTHRSGRSSTTSSMTRRLISGLRYTGSPRNQWSYPRCRAYQPEQQSATSGIHCGTSRPRGTTRGSLQPPATAAHNGNLVTGHPDQGVTQVWLALCVGALVALAVTILVRLSIGEVLMSGVSDNDMTVARRIRALNRD